MTWAASCGLEPCLAHYARRPAGCICPSLTTPAGCHLTALDGRCVAHLDGNLPRQHVVYCYGCGRAWLDPPGNAACTCADWSAPYYEKWAVDPDPAIVPAEAWSRPALPQSPGGSGFRL